MEMRENLKTKSFNVTYQFAAIGTSTIQVPESYNLEQAIDFAKSNMALVPIPTNWSYVDDSEELFEENCDFEDW